MDIGKLLGLAASLNVPGLLVQGVEFVKEVKAAADKTPHILSEADRAELDQIHTDALAAADRLDAKLAEAEKH